MRTAAKAIRAAACGAMATLGVMTWQAGVAKAAIVERVVAVVGERPILLSELRHRAMPYLYRIEVTTPNPAQKAAAETEMFRELLNRMIDDRLEEQAADKAHLSVTSEEVDSALKNVATSARLPVPELLAEARKQGLSEQDYRDEIRRQVLEGKLVQLRVRGRVRVTDQDARAAYARWLKDSGPQAASTAELRILAMRLAGLTQDEMSAKEALAGSIVKQVREGGDFCKMVAQYTDDQPTKESCGSRGVQPVAALVPQLQEAIKDMKQGETSDPIRYGDEAILILQLVTAPRTPTFEDVQNEMEARAYNEVLERQRKQWLLELRRGMYVDVRL